MKNDELGVKKSERSRGPAAYFLIPNSSFFIPHSFPTPPHGKARPGNGGYRTPAYSRRLPTPSKRERWTPRSPIHSLTEPDPPLIFRETSHGQARSEVQG